MNEPADLIKLPKLIRDRINFYSRNLETIKYMQCLGCNRFLERVTAWYHTQVENYICVSCKHTYIICLNCLGSKSDEMVEPDLPPCTVGGSGFKNSRERFYLNRKRPAKFCRFIGYNPE